MIPGKSKIRSFCLTLLFAIVSAFPVMSAQIPGYDSTSPLRDISSVLPPVRGIGFDELAEGIPDKAAMTPDPESAEGISLIATALSWMGTPYRLGGFSKSGVDCSGFLYNVLKATVPELGPFPRQSDEYSGFGLRSETIEPGDILLFAYDKSIYHVGLALSGTTFIHSASEGARTGVIISSLNEGNWGARLYGVRRLRQ
jgi:hypothetical protein